MVRTVDLSWRVRGTLGLPTAFHMICFILRRLSRGCTIASCTSPGSASSTDVVHPAAGNSGNGHKTALLNSRRLGNALACFLAWFSSHLYVYCIDIYISNCMWPVYLFVYLCVSNLYMNIYTYKHIYMYMYIYRYEYKYVHIYIYIFGHVYTYHQS